MKSKSETESESRVEREGSFERAQSISSTRAGKVKCTGLF